MKKQALKVAQNFDELAQIGYEHVLMSEGDSAVSKQLMHYQLQFAKEHEENAQLLRDLVAEIERLEDIRNDYAEREAKFLKKVSE